jgi:hypothetical protein
MRKVKKKTKKQFSQQICNTEYKSKAPTRALDEKTKQEK